MLSHVQFAEVTYRGVVVGKVGSMEYIPNGVRATLDIEREWGLSEGNIFQGELTLEQLFFLRPAPGWANYKTPVRNLYMCGSATHPGGGIMAAPGRNAAMMILDNTRGGRAAGATWRKRDPWSLPV